MAIYRKGSANPMLLDAHSLEFKVVLVSIWILPFVALAVLTRDWRVWVSKIFCSLASVALFAISFLLLMTIIVADFEHGLNMHMSVPEVLLKSFYGMFVFFPGLVLVIIAGALSVMVRPRFPYDLFVALLTSLFHLLYLFSIIILTTQ